MEFRRVLFRSVRPTWTHASVSAGARLGMQWRAHGREISCTVTHVDSEHLTFVTDEFIRGVAPGQQAVFYDGDRVVGSVTIDSSARV